MSAEPTGGARAWLVWGVAVGGYFLAMLHRNGLGVAALEAQARFDVGPALLSLLPMLQLLVYVLLQVPAGLLADRLGPRYTLVMGMVAMVVGSCLFALAPGIETAVAGRFLIGLGDALVFLNVIRLAALWFPRARYALVSGLTGVVGGTGQVASAAPLAWALGQVGWVVAFLSTTALTALMALLVLLVVRDRPVGAAGHSTVADPISVWESLKEALRARGPLIGMAHHAAVMAPFTMMMVLWGYPFLVSGLGLEEGTAALTLTGLAAGGLWVAPFVGVLVGRRPHVRRWLALTLGAALSVGWVLLVVWPGGTPVAVGLTVMAVSAAGQTLAPTISFDFARDGIPASRTGVASGLVNMSGFTTAVLCTVAAGAILQALPDEPESYQLAFVPMCVTTVAATAVLYCFVLARPRSRA
ncbi:MFS transporter [Nocardiopsis sp. CT-R113]|uniref:Lysosomal dipeptide transporter MFSD1 n=1 Tax=Nocardiopsis codii TaxID=3065942 RepID=A0ABU7KA92_9ACTN|nr:MFS transporter [Nocardiopsis sp. CT-R113]MEE2039153.1 MFS transporter [Nocardiopsis sp. CT-R113]